MFKSPIEELVKLLGQISILINQCGCFAMDDNVKHAKIPNKNP